jgi:hypothetical protein
MIDLIITIILAGLFFGLLFFMALRAIQYIIEVFDEEL